MSIREWAKTILTSGKIENLLDLLKEANSQVSKIPLGSDLTFDWVLPQQINFYPPRPKPPPEVRLLHSISQIELMAIYMYWDTLSMVNAPIQFYCDMSEIAIQECTHLYMLMERIRDLGYEFPSLPCATYLQELSKKTCDDIKARILITSLYSEGRALDSKDRLLNKLRGYNKDLVSAKILEKIIADEVNHLKNGISWFQYFCDEEGVESKNAHDKLVDKLGLIYRPPFNQELRSLAGMPHEWYS